MERGAADRKVMKVAVEEFPLRAAPIPPCSISALAVTKGNEISSVAVYLGTDTGYVLFFLWNRAAGAPSAATPQSPFPRIRPLRNSPSRNSQPSTPRSRHSPSPSSREEISISSPPKGKGPPSAGSDVEYQNALELADSKSSFQASPERQKNELKLSMHRYLGRGSIESLCVLENIGQIAVLVDGQVLLINSSSLAPVGRFPNSKGVSVIAPAISFEDKLPPRLADSTVPDDERAHLAVALKNRILLFEVLSWQQEKENRASSTLPGTNLSVMKEIPGIEGAVTIAWIKRSIFIGTWREYIMFSLLDGRATLLFSFPVESPWRPLLKTFPKASEVLLVMDIAGIVVNCEGQPVAGSLIFSGIPDAIGQSSPYAVVVNKGVVDLFHSKTGAKVQSIAYGSVPTGTCLVEDDNENVVVITNGDKVSCLIHVSVDDQLKELLKQKAYSEAVKLATDECSESDDSSRTRLAVVYAEAGFLLLSDLRFEEAIDHFLQSEIVEPTELFPFFPSLTSRWRSMVPRKRYWGLHSPPQPLRTVIENGLMSLRNGLFVSLNNDSTKPQVATIGDASGRTVMFNQYLLNAIQQFIRYWEITRGRNLNATAREAVDTVLLKMYVELGSTRELELLVASTNYCLLEEVENLLRSTGQLRALALLYESKNMLESALQIWQYLAYSTEFSTTVATSEAARLLETCSEKELVLQHIHWVIDLDAGMALTILTSSKREESLPADEVLGLLKADDSMIRQRYLQWLVEDQGSDDCHIHTELALSLADSALKKTNEDGCREVLQEFLEKSSKYDAAAILNLIGGTNLWKEQAILHMKLGNEVLALEILALKLEDSEAAERYCAQLGKPDAYMQLLQLYLGSEGKERLAVGLLDRHGPRLDPSEVLEALPPDMPLHLACQALIRMLRARVHCHRQGQIAKNLTRSVNFQIRMSKLEERSRQIQITSDSVCSSCNARLGTKLFAVYPDDSVVCYKCLRLRGQQQ